MKSNSLFFCLNILYSRNNNLTNECEYFFRIRSKFFNLKKENRTHSEFLKVRNDESNKGNFTK